MKKNKKNLVDFSSSASDGVFLIGGKNKKSKQNQKNSNGKKKTQNSSSKEKVYEGVFIGTGKNYNFCFCSDLNEDVFIPPKKAKGAIDGDRVMVKVKQGEGNKKEGVVFKITKRSNNELVGNLIKIKKDFFVVPDNNKITRYIKVEKRHLFGAKIEDKVVCRLTYQPENEKDRFLGQVIEILGESESEQTLELAILRAHHIYEKFPEEVALNAEKISKKGISKKDLEKRMDLTKRTIFTIDGADAKDLDDAVSLSILPNGNYELGVHIADVGEYVKKDSVLDKEAFLRGTSVYFPTMTFPMLPKSISNGICSLFENEIRLTLSVFMEINKEGEVVNHRICESYIKSVARLTYDEVYDALLGKVNAKTKNLKDTLIKMNQLAKLLKKKRVECGELDFDIAEPYFEVNENGEVLSISKRERNDAHKLIESFMIICNETVAKEFANLKIPFAYRIHESPTNEKLKNLIDFLAGIGITCPPAPSVITPSYYKQILRLIENNPLKESLNKMILRSLQKARYSNECLGHFGLALQYYCHFTSPIRRYPDLLIHRIIKQKLAGKNFSKDLKEFVFEACEQSSQKERSADEAERDADDLKKVQYMKKFVGKEFEGIISSVTSFGFFVELENTVEGLVKLETLDDDSYLFFEKSLKLKGQKHCFSIGDKVTVIVANCNVFDRKIEFTLKKV